ncbi:MAG: hypothetical protein K2M48_06200, partial [Clostridiales bacterium]|nr:hypothetical protein [Clostridiales bacterium]
VKKGEYAEISVNSETKSDAVSAVSSNKDVIDNVTYNYNAATLAFRLLSAGKADIIVTANINNDADEVVARLHIEAQSSSDLGLIDSIYFTDKPVTADFYKENWTNAANSGVLKDAAGIKLVDASKALTLAYNTNNRNYNNVLDHIVLVPFTLQCSKTGEGQNAKYELKGGWQSKVTVSTDSKLCDVIRSWNNQLKYYTYGLHCDGLSSGTECKITVSDNTPGAVAAPCDVYLNMVAPNTTINMSFTLGDKTIENDDILKSIQNESDAIVISQSEVADLTVSYEFLAPANVDATTMVRKGYVSTGYTLSLTDPNFATIMLKPVGEKDDPITLDKEYKFNSSNFTVALKPGQTTTYIGTATFSLAVGDSNKVKSGLYTLTFKKSGMTVLTDDDPDVECKIRFRITSVAKKASFIDDDDEANAIITNNGARAGKFVRTTDNSCDIYIQNQRSGVKLADIIKFADLFTADQGEVRITGTIDTKTNNSTFDGSNGTSYENLVFNGNDQSSYNNNDYNTCQAELPLSQ